MNSLIGLVEYQDRVIKENKVKQDATSAKVFDSNSCMLVSGIHKREGENCKILVQTFLKKILKITEEVGINRAFRVGGESSSAIMFYLACPSLKGLIFKNISRLKGIKNQYGEYFNLREILTGADNEKQKHAREAVYENRYLPHNQKLQLKIVRGQLRVEDEVYQSEINCPERTEVLRWDEKKVSTLSKLYSAIRGGNEYKFKGSTFCGYTVEVGTLEEMNEYYATMRHKHVNARHIVGVLQLPGRNFVKYQDGYDDGEHGAARFILNAMKHSEMFHRAIFVTRHYDGEQIGLKCFEMYLKAVRSAVLHNPLLPHREIMHKPWSEEYCEVSDSGPTAKDGGMDGATSGGIGDERSRGCGRGHGWSRGSSQSWRGWGRGCHGPPVR